MNLPHALYTAEQVRQLDSVAIHDFEIPGLTLMTRAGEAVFSVLTDHYSDRGRVVVVCGIGNNGGDGYVVGRLLHQHGFEVDVLQLGDSSKVKGDALLARQAMEQSGLSAKPFTSERLAGAGAVVDALFGTGLEREVTGDWAEAICVINHSPAVVVAVDIPSGLHSDSGAVLGMAVKADHTVSFIGLKLGMFTQCGRDYCGAVVFDDLNIPHEVYASLNASARRLSWENRQPLLSPRDHNVHKGSFGHVLAIGGELGMPGAITLTAQSVARVGAGLVSVATREPHAVPMAMSYPVLMAHSVENSEQTLALLQKATMLAVGPGLGQGAWGQSMLHMALKSELPMVLDADGLNLLAQRNGDKRDNWVLTPHPLEAARLLGISADEVQADRLGAVTAIANQYGGICLLKGAGTLISDGEHTLLCDAGNGAMASGGMGDVLTGIIAGLLAQEPQQFGVELVAQAALLHAHCADNLVDQGYGRLLATDILVQLPFLVKEI